jgi:GNAT superfamily N-acetyltransferase
MASSIHFFEREMTAAEYGCEQAGFDEYSLEQGDPIESAERFGFVVTDSEIFIGCASGLAYKSDAGYNNWFYLSDLFIEKDYRRQGLGATILSRLEDRVAALGIGNIWTWTVGQEALAFYKRQGYQVFGELEAWYASGHSRYGLRKKLKA